MELRYPEGLPIVERREELVAAIRDHQVVVVAGETGSGKSTQLPKLCLEAGRGSGGLIGHTQPRRIAARAVAERVAEELGVEVGAEVGYAVRFTDRVGLDTRVKLMTDGILLAELQRDRDLSAYDTLIVDEAHERSLNIDFLLGYLTRLLPRRPDLKLVVTSATIDTAKFAAHFGGAPVVEVSGRSYPVEVRYRPLDEDTDQTQGIVDACEELRGVGDGDVLVFLSGEREIRDTADAIERRGWPGTEVLPLYARLSSAEQHRVFAPHRGRRIVLATNVAETSLTVPGIRYVVDPGTARISRYNRRTKVQRLPIEPISRASANQRAGRCGRVAPGVCIRLYDEEGFEARPEFTEPEVLRTNLASVILQMAAIGLGDVEAFPFVDPPDARSIGDGIALLTELGAFRDGRITKQGRRLARLPVDPRLGRMVLEADRLGCLHEVLIIAAALAIIDPRERPAGKEQQAAELHGRFGGDGSDFLAYLRLWEHLRAEQRARSSSGFRRMCRAELLNWLRVREWQDVHSQLRRIAAGQGLRQSENPASPDAVHQALLAGLLSHLGHWDPDARTYRGARGTTFDVARGSTLGKRRPAWVMAAELVETDRIRARTLAAVDPRWIEDAAGDQARRSHSEPWWDERDERAMVDEHVHLYGLPIVERRRVPLSRIDRDRARDLFIEHALLGRPSAAMDEVEAIEDRLRRRDLLIDDEDLHTLYGARLGPDVTSRRHLDSWLKRQPAGVLDLQVGDVLDPRAGSLDLDAVPRTVYREDVELRLDYVFDPDDDRDGVTVDVPVDVLHRLDLAPLSWHVEAHRPTLVTAVLRALPKAVRRELGPMPEVVAAALAETDPTDGPVLDVLARWVTKRIGTAVDAGDVRLDAVEPWLLVTWRAVDGAGRPIAWSKDLDALRTKLEGRTRRALAEATRGIERTGLTAWTIGDVPRTAERTIDGRAVVSYPALIDEGATAGVRVFATEADQAAAMARGTRRLVLLQLGSTRKMLESGLGNDARLALARSGFATAGERLDDVAAATVDHLVTRAGGPAWDEAAFMALVAEVKRGFGTYATAAARSVATIAAEVAAVEARLDRLSTPALQPSVDDAWAHLARLVGPGFVAAAGVARLPDVDRYVRALARRLDKLPEDPSRDRRALATARALEAELRGEPAARWMLEEHRVGLFAQALGTKGPASEQRIRRALT